MKRGKLIIIDGTDGSGKTTQLGLLKGYLEAKGKKVATLDFPQYNEFWGKMAGRFLAGEFGEMDGISPYLVQPFYMLDQASRKDEINAWLDEGRIVLSNRYITSSMIHQAARLPDSDKNDFLEWINLAGYEKLGIVKEDLVVMLYVPTEISMKLSQDKASADRKSYTKGGKDIAEVNYDHQKKSSEMALRLCSENKHWIKIDCTKDGKLLSKEDVFEKLLREVMHLID